MFNFIVKKVSGYLIFLSFSFVVLIAVSFVVETQDLKVSNPFKIPYVAFSTIKPQVDSERVQVIQNPIIRISNYPVKGGHLSSRFGMRTDPIHGQRRMHQGIDIAARSGTFVYPMGKGKVIFSGRKAGYGKTIEIQHGNTVVTRYAHLEELLIDEGREVSKDDIIGLVGNTGRSTGPHLHLEVTLNDKKVDPQIFLIGDIASR